MPSRNVSTLAGNYSVMFGFADGVGTNAVFWTPAAIAMDYAQTFAIIVSLG